MNVLPMKKKIAIISALVRGSGIRATEGITGVEKKTISKLALAVGEGCARLLDAKMRNVNATQIQFDEQWSFVNTKQGHLKADSPLDFGDSACERLLGVEASASPPSEATYAPR